MPVPAPHQNPPTAPVLLIVFNRPDTTARVMEAIRQARPRQLFVAADGPRPHKPGEAARCAQARRMATEVDWPCTVTTLFRDGNLGCRVAVSSAISWFFEQVGAGIILEDDCLPDPTFFSFCTELLARHADNQRVMHIGGTSLQLGRTAGYPADYYASGYAPIWGWATWQRAWAAYDVDIQEEPTGTWFVEPYFNNRQRWYVAQVRAGRIDTWDIQWLVSVRRAGGVSLLPKHSLIRNIGFSLEATHTYRPPDWFARMDYAPLPLPLTHPASLRIDTEADRFESQTVHRQVWYLRLAEPLYFWVRKLLGSALPG